MPAVQISPHEDSNPFAATAAALLGDLQPHLLDRRGVVLAHDPRMLQQLAFVATHALERYIDAHAGGTGKGWFRIVTWPADARPVIADGKLAVILGIETSNPVDRVLEPRPGYPPCDDAMARAKLDRYDSLGVSVLFPVHKFDNGFSAGDGHRGIIELRNILNSGRLLSFTDAAGPDVAAVFDRGGITVGGLNAPRADYASPGPIDFAVLQATPFHALPPYLGRLLAPSLAGDYCQSAGL